jgi:hypothetical protein
MTERKFEPGRGWTRAQAHALAYQIEGIAPRFGAHVALTGGCLYNGEANGNSERKDVDILFYRIRHWKEIDEPGLLAALTLHLDIAIGPRYGWVQKARWFGKNIDLFFPESDHNNLMPDGSEYGFNMRGL